MRAALERCPDISEYLLAKSEVLGGNILWGTLTFIHSISTTLLNSLKICVCVSISAGWVGHWSSSVPHPPTSPWRIPLVTACQSLKCSDGSHQEVNVGCACVLSEWEAEQGQEERWRGGALPWAMFLLYTSSWSPLYMGNRHCSHFTKSKVKLRKAKCLVHGCTAARCPPFCQRPPGLRRLVLLISLWRWH